MRTSSLSALLMREIASGISPLAALTLPRHAIELAVSGESAPTVRRKMASASAMCFAAGPSSPSFSCARPSDMCALAMMEESSCTWPAEVCSFW